MNTLQFTLKSDIIGAMASSICLVHCIATPFIFVAQAGIHGHGESHPLWWGTIDIIFLLISLIAIWKSSKTTSKNWMRFALWISWLFLAVVVINEKISLFPLMEEAIYIPSIAIIFFHIYNRKYCQSHGEECRIPS